jgi:hypothetical protein
MRKSAPGGFAGEEQIQDSEAEDAQGKSHPQKQ